MGYVKTLGLVALAATALMVIAGAGNASATVLCSTTVEECPQGQKWLAGTVLDWTIPSGGSNLLTTTSGETIDKCSAGTKKWKIINVGSTTETVTAAEEETTLGSCTFPTKTLTTSKIEIHKIAGTSNGTVTSDGKVEKTINTILFGSCVFGYEAGVDIGEVTEGNPAVLHTNIVAKVFGGGAACPESARWTGTYTLTAPAGTTLSVAFG